MRRLTLFIAAALLIASAGAAFGVDKINGKDLNDIHDIIREVDGDDAAIVPKASLLEITLVGGDSSLHGNLWTAPIDQSRRSYSTKKDVMTMSSLNDRDHYMGIAAAVSTRRIMYDGAARRVVVGDLKYGGSGSIKTFLTEPTKDGSIKISGDVRSLPVKFPGAGSKLAFTDMRGGLFIDGERTESFVAGFMDDKDRKDTFSGGDNGGKIAGVGFLILDGRKLNDESFTGDPTAYVMADAESTDSQFPVLRIVAGDFDGDGIRSEIAYIATPKDKPYYLHIYKVSRDAKDSSKVKLEDLWSETIGNVDLGMFHGSQRDTEAGCDIVAGDFDGDGRTELAAAVISGTGSKLKPLVKTYKFVDGKFKSSSEVFGNVARDIKDTVVPGLLAAAGDFDGNGADDVAVVTTQKYTKDVYNMQMEIFAFDAVSGEAPKPVPNWHEYGAPMGHPKYTPLARAVSLAAGPTYAAAGNGGFYDDIIYSFNGSAGYQGFGDSNKYKNVIVMNMGDGAHGHYLSTASRSNEDAKVSALMIADLAGESMALGECVHIITEDVRSFNTVLPAVPYHIDYIRSDWRDPKATPDPRALQFIAPQMNLVQYSKTDTDSETTDTDFKNGGGIEGEVALAVDIHTPGQNMEAKPHEGRLKWLGVNVGGGVDLHGSYNRLNEKLSSYKESKSTALDSIADVHDIAHYYLATLHTWRYPIIGTLADDADRLDKILTDENSGGDVPKNDPMKNEPIDPKAQKYYSITRLTDLRDGFSGADPGDRYQPPYDERNLFSYPTDLKFIKDYTTKQVELSSESHYRTDIGETKKISFDSIRSNSKTTVDSWGGGVNINVNGGIAVPAGKRSIFSGHFDASLDGNFNISNAKTFNTTTNASESFSVTIKEDKEASYSVFQIFNAAYIGSGGIKTLGFAIDLRPDDAYPARAWEKTGPYGKSPDPSLILPGRVFVDNDGAAAVEPRPSVATALRGVRIYDLTRREDAKVGTSYTVSTLVRGRKYQIVVPIYNASFVDTGNFKVQLGYTTNDHLDEILTATKGVPASDDAAVTPIASIDTSLSKWTADSDKHRDTVTFEWEVPEDLPRDHYDLCVRIVGRTDDIHRDWNVNKESSEYDPCGNDWGHYLISVIDEKDLQIDEKDIVRFKASSLGGVDIKAAASPGEPNVKLAFKVDGQSPMTFDEFRRWLTGRTDQVNVEIEVAYTGDKVVHGAYVMVYELLEDGRIRTLVDRDLSALFPGRSISRHVRIDPQKFLSRDLRVKISGSSISHTFGEPTEDGSGSSGSGCAAGAAGIAAIALLFAATQRKK